MTICAGRFALPDDSRFNMKLFPSFPVRKSIAAFLCSFGLTLANASAELKVAMVDMSHLLNNYHKSIAAEEEEKVNREAIQQGDVKRTEDMKALVEEMKKHQLDMRDPQLSETKRKSILATAQEKNEALKNLQAERKEFLERSGRALNEKMVGLMDEIRTEVIEAVGKYAEGAEVDYVLDQSGLTSTQVPFVVYVRDPVDITADVLKLLNKDASAKPEEEKKAAE